MIPFSTWPKWCRGCFQAFGLLIFALTLVGSASAWANPKAAPFTYPYMTLPKGSGEFEQYVDMTPVKVTREDPGGSVAVTSLRSVFLTEIEYGITDRLEFGWYFMFKQGGSSGVPFLRFQGLKQRLRYRFKDPGVWPVDVGVYLEVAEMHNEIEVEQKVILSKRFGRLMLTTNLWLEQEFYWQTKEFKILYNPTLAATYEFSPNFMLSLEGWVRGRLDKKRGPTDFDNRSDSPLTVNPYLGPTMMLQSGRFWLSIGAYLRLRDVGRFTAVQGISRSGDPWGPFWVRTLVGLGL